MRRCSVKGSLSNFGTHIPKFLNLSVAQASLAFGLLGNPAECAKDFLKVFWEIRLF